jgi:hypothetical protein
VLPSIVCLFDNPTVNMPKRNSQLTHHHSHHHIFHLSQDVSGPIGFLNPTRARLHHTAQLNPDSSSGDHPDASRNNEDDDDQLVDDVQFQWRTRDNRKGRHAIVVKPAAPGSKSKTETPEMTSSMHAIVQGIWRMVVCYPVWDVSYLVAILFTLGSVVWCINGFFAFLPLVRPSSEFKDEEVYGGGITAFIGATIFEIGSILLMVEAVNENRTGCFGWAVEKAISGEHGEVSKLKPDEAGCTHHHSNKKNLVGKGDTSQKPSENGKAAVAAKEEMAANSSESDTSTDSEVQGWVWFPSWHELTSHYFREIGFLACLSQMIGATIFWIAGFTSLPKIYNTDNRGLQDGIYWTPQVVGGIGFVVSGLLFMLETQKKWYQPAWEVLGWHIGLWNFIGALGFTVSLPYLSLD